LLINTFITILSHHITSCLLSLRWPTSVHPIPNSTPNSKLSHRIRKSHTEIKYLWHRIQNSHTEFESLTLKSKLSRAHRIRKSHWNQNSHTEFESLNWIQNFHTNSKVSRWIQNSHTEFKALTPNSKLSHRIHRLTLHHETLKLGYFTNFKVLFLIILIIFHRSWFFGHVVPRDRLLQIIYKVQRHISRQESRKNIYD
jgi:hypothetical protein